MKIIHFWRSELKLQKAKPTCYRRGLNCVPLPPHLMAPHSSTLAWKIPWMEEPGRLQSMESLRVGHDWETSLSLFTFMHWRRKWQPTPVFLPGESQDGGAWWAAIYGVAQSRTWLSDWTELNWTVWFWYQGDGGLIEWVRSRILRLSFWFCTGIQRTKLPGCHFLLGTLTTSYAVWICLTDIETFS